MDRAATLIISYSRGPSLSREPGRTPHTGYEEKVVTWVLGLDGLEQPACNGESGVGPPVGLGVEAHRGAVATARLAVNP